MFRDRTTISRSSRYRCLGIFFRSDTEIYCSLCRLKSPEPVRSSSLRPRPSIIPDQAEAWEEPQSWHCGSSCFNCPDHANCHGLSPRQRKASSNCHRPVGKLNKEINAALAEPGTKSRFADIGGSVVGGSSTDFAKLVSDETEKWGKVIRAAHIKAE